MKHSTNDAAPQRKNDVFAVAHLASWFLCVLLELVGKACFFGYLGVLTPSDFFKRRYLSGSESVIIRHGQQNKTTTKQNNQNIWLRWEHACFFVSVLLFCCGDHQAINKWILEIHSWRDNAKRFFFSILCSQVTIQREVALGWGKGRRRNLRCVSTTLKGGL